MGLLRTLISGGVFVGKVCQSLMSGLIRKDALTGIQVQAADMKLSGVTFFRSNAANGEEMKTYAFNTNTDCIMRVGIPPLENGCSFSYAIAPTHKECIDDFFAPNIPPTTELLVGAETADNAQEGNDVNNSVIKVALNNLTVGSGTVVSVGSLGFEMTLSGLIVSGVIAFGGMIYLYFRNRQGVVAHIQATVEPVATNTVDINGDKRYEYKVNFGELGFRTGDVIGGEVNIVVKRSEYQKFLGFSNQTSEPLHEVERRLLGL